MYKVNIPKLTKLIDFLEELPEKKFNFGEVVEAHDHDCGTVCCAIGWTPKIFPTEVEWDLTHLSLTLEGGSAEYEEVANRLFGMSCGLAANLFTPDCQRDVHCDLTSCLSDASAKEVATMLRQFVGLLEAGEIEGHE